MPRKPLLVLKVETLTMQERLRLRRLGYDVHVSSYYCEEPPSIWNLGPQIDAIEEKLAHAQS